MTGSPATNVRSRVQVSMGGEPARLAEELRLRTTVGVLTMPTAATGLTGVGRVHVDHRHTRQRRLVGNERPKLKERPTVQHSPPALSNRFPGAFSDALKVLEGNPAPRVFRRLHDGLADIVVDIGHEVTKRRSRPLRCFKRRLLDLVLRVWSFWRKRLNRART